MTPLLPDDDTLLKLGLSALRAGDFAASATHLKRALALTPQSQKSHGIWRDLLTSAQAWSWLVLWSSRRSAIDGYPLARFDRATGLLRGGQPDAALLVIRPFAAAFPSEAAVWAMIGEIAQQKNHFERALTGYERALCLVPGRSDLTARVIMIQVQVGASVAALSRFGSNLGAETAPAEILEALVQAMLASGRRSDAAFTLRRMAERSPMPDAAPDWLLQSAGIAMTLGDTASTLSALQRVAALVPNHGLAYSNLSDLLRLSRPETALLMALRSLACAPTAEAFGNLGLARLILHEFDKVERPLRQAIALTPGHLSSQVNLSHFVLMDGRTVETETWSRRSISLDPANPQLPLNLAFALLTQGKLVAGLQLYEHRLIESGSSSTFTTRIIRPRWAGEPLRGRRLFIWQEQGIGDHFLFSRYLPMVPTEDGNVVVECDPRLVSLNQRSFPNLISVPARPSIEETLGGMDVDLQIPVTSLGLVFSRESEQALKDARRGSPWPLLRYLKADPGKVEAWEKRLSSRRSRLRVAISWRGGNLSATHTPHYMSVQHIVGMLEDLPITVVNVQYSAMPEEIERLQRGLVDFLHPDINLKDDLEDVAAILSCCDLLISATTSVLYLGAALGTPSWAFTLGHTWPTYGLEGRQPLLPSLRYFDRAIVSDWSATARQMRQTLMSALSAPESEMLTSDMPRVRTP